MVTVSSNYKVNFRRRIDFSPFMKIAARPYSMYTEKTHNTQRFQITNNVFFSSVFAPFETWDLMPLDLICIILYLNGLFVSRNLGTSY